MINTKITYTENDLPKFLVVINGKSTILTFIEDKGRYVQGVDEETGEIIEVLKSKIIKKVNKDYKRKVR